MAYKVGVILMTYGSATSSDNVSAYMHHIYPDAVPTGVIEDFENRYRLVGGSPLIAITTLQASKLSQTLNETSDTPDRKYLVSAAMLHSEPFLSDVVKQMHQDGARDLIGIILSPQFSSYIMDGYKAVFRQAARANGFPDSACIVAGPWPDEPKFIQYVADNTAASLDKLNSTYRKQIPIAFTTHSLPQRVVDKDPDYLMQLNRTIDALVSRLRLPREQWSAAYQSAGHTPEAWLKPDLVDILEQYKSKKFPAVLIVPIQFLADHLEILYDLDIAAKAQCQDFGIHYNRIALPNTDPLFIQALAAITRRTQHQLSKHSATQ